MHAIDDSDADEEAMLSRVKLHGFPSTLPKQSEAEIDWRVAKAWEDELEKLNAKRPRNIDGIEKVAIVDTILGYILPFRLVNQDVKQSEETKMKFKREVEDKLNLLLLRVGF